MTYPYGTKGAPAVGGGLPGLPRRVSAFKSDPRGEMIFTTPGQHSFVIPEGVHSICAVCVGAGARVNNNNSGRRAGGGGGGLAWKNNIPVVPGSTITVQVSGHSSSGTFAVSYVIGEDVVAASAGGGSTLMTALTPGEFLAGDGGGDGGSGGSFQSTNANNGGGGGGAGGYSGNGTSGTDGGLAPRPASLSATGGAGSGGCGGSTADGGYGGGGVGLYGEGPSGAGSSTGGKGGSGGQDGSIGANPHRVAGGDFGGGAGGSATGAVEKWGGRGAVRIVWGKGRAFPSTDVGPTY